MIPLHRLWRFQLLSLSTSWTWMRSWIRSILSVSWYLSSRWLAWITDGNLYMCHLDHFQKLSTSSSTANWKQRHVLSENHPTQKDWSPVRIVEWLHSRVWAKPLEFGLKDVILALANYWVRIIKICFQSMREVILVSSGWRHKVSTARYGSDKYPHF